MTLKDRQWLAVIPNDPDTPMTVKDHQRHPVTGNDYVETKPKFGAKSSNLSERLWKTVNGHERPSTTLKDSQRLAVIPKDPETLMTAKDRQQHSATGNDYMETRLNNWRNGV